jgi:phosphoribosylaminoimidazole-succinocarboxamide synthase
MNVPLISKPFTPTSLPKRRIKRLQFVPTVVNTMSDKKDIPYKLFRSGKVRDIYEKNDSLICVTTNRQSAFDRNLATIPYKGQVLNMTSAWWFLNTEHIIQNALIAVPHPYVSIMKKLTPLPIEIIVRAYITGTTNTSLWTIYEKGNREYCGNILRDGLVKNEKLPYPIITPTTKGEVDVPISGQQIVDQGLMTESTWNEIYEKSLKLFNYGRNEADKRGLILVDTKYEFGYDDKGNIHLMDEVHTPDSSRFWLKDSYVERFERGLEPEYIDKEFLRIWFKNNCNPYNDITLPEAPVELTEELSRKYIKLFEMITGESFVPNELNYDELVESVNLFLDNTTHVIK